MGEPSKHTALLGEALQSDRCTKGDSPLSGTADSRFIDRTLELWQQRSTRPLTRENARQIIDNATGFFRILLEWETAERNATKRVGSMKRAKGRLP